MIDMGNDKNSTYGGNDYQFNFGYNSSIITEYKHNALTGVTFAQGSKSNGYIIEIRIPWIILGTPPIDGEAIGFEVQVNDDDDGGVRDSKIGWNDGADMAFNNPSSFGTLNAAACDPCPSGVLSGDHVACDAVSSSPLTIKFTGNGPWNYTYSIDGVLQPSVSGITNSPYIVQSGMGAHNYLLVSVSNSIALGCSANATGSATISINSNLPIGHNGIFISPGSANLSVNNGGGTYQWYDAPVGGNLIYTGILFTTPALTDTTIYYVQEATGAPCRIEVKAIPVVPSSQGKFFIPNLITPNNDGKNDHFEITALPSGSALDVFNRWGDRIYQSSDYDNLWAGNNTSDGVYYYDLILPDGKQYKGWLNIVR